MIRCIAIDDEPLALQQTVSYIKRTPFLQLKAQCKSAANALDIVNSEDIDLMFVDINMPDITGLEFVKSLQNHIMIIFTTAYSEYAIEGFKVDALDYLLKPFGYDEFLRAAMKAQNHWNLIKHTEPTTEEQFDYIFVKSDQRMVKIPFSNITYIESQGEYVKIFISGGSNEMPLLSMSIMEQKLPPERFMRVHRSYIINLDHIVEISYNRILLTDGKKIPIGDMYRDPFLLFVNKNMVKK